jgi:hypothetical protein
VPLTEVVSVPISLHPALFRAKDKGLPPRIDLRAQWRKVENGPLNTPLLEKERIVAHAHSAASRCAIRANTLYWETPEGESVPYKVRCEAPDVLENGAIENLSLKQLDDPIFKERIRSSIPKNVLRIFAPTVDRMSGVILDSDRFTTIYPLTFHMDVHRPGFQKNSSEKEGCDGTRIGQSEAFLMSAGGCPLIVLSGRTYRGEELCIAAHAGRDSLIDKKLLRTRIKSREYGSVVDAMVAFARKNLADPKELVLRSFFSIPWEAYPHDLQDPKFGDINGKRFYFLGQHRSDDGIFIRRDGITHFCLSTLIRRQAEKYNLRRVETGIRTLPINDVFTYTTHPTRGELLRNLVSLTR